MGTTTDKLNKLIETKNAIRTSITNKGGELTESDKFSDYATVIDNLSTGGEDTRFKDLVEGTITEINDSSITKVGNHAFSNCSGLTSVSFPNATSIGGSAFYECGGLTNVNIPSVTSISDRAFFECSKLTTINIQNASHISIYAFYNCSNLISIEVPNVSTVYDNAFYGCSSLTSIDFPNVTSIARYTFQKCSGLTSINIPNAIKIGKSAFDGCSSLTSIDFPNVTDSIEEDAFAGCSSLTSINLPNATNIGSNRLFAGCSSLTSVSFPHATSIGYMCFYRCSSLTGVNIPTVTYIGSYAFSNCTSLMSIVLQNETKVATLSSTNAFDSTPIQTSVDSGFIYVPDSLVDSYKTATNWSTFADKIKPLSFENGGHISNLSINNSKLSLTTPRNASIYLDGFTNTPDININVSNENVAQVNNINTTTEKITFEVIALGEEGNATITVNVSGDYSKTLTIEVSYAAPIEHRVEQISEATHGFTLNSNDYYESTNKGIANSYSLCKLVFNATEMNNILKLECINSGESNYDFGILSNIDTTLSLGSSADSTNVYKSFNGQSSTSPVTITYPETTAGEHYIYIKYKKDSSGDNGNDSLQFKVIS